MQPVEVLPIDVRPTFLSDIFPATMPFDGLDLPAGGKSILKVISTGCWGIAAACFILV